MDLFKDILISALSKETAQVSFPSFDGNIEKLFEKECYLVLLRIKEILNDHTLEDDECFYSIEHIVQVFEDLGCMDLSRHDFG